MPILVGGISKEKEVSFGRLLAPYLEREDTICVVSSDFCHWYTHPLFRAMHRSLTESLRGTRFQYTHYYGSAPDPNSDTPPTEHRLSRSCPSPTSLSRFPIHASIEALDREALQLLTIPGPFASVAECHEAFSAYLMRTKNTICGRHPIGVLLGVLAHLEKAKGGGGDSTEENKRTVVKWVRYAQSSQCFNVNDSSVSYACAYVVF